MKYTEDRSDPNAEPGRLDPDLEKVHGAQRHLVGTAARIVMAPGGVTALK